MGSRTMYAVLDQAAQRYGEAPAMHQPIGKGKYHTYSWIDYKCAVQEIACGLRSLGIGKGDVVAIHAETRAEFYLADLGILANGSIAAALYTTYPVLDQIGNLRASDAKAVFVEDSKSMQALIDAAGQNPLPVQWILLTGQAENALTLEALRAAGRKLVADDPQVFERICAEVQPEDAAILYLTSGATGEPKMGLTTHAALVANVDMGPIALRLTPDDCTISFLPSAHIAQRVVIELLPIEMGVPVWFSESLAKLPAEMKTIRPTFLLAPPRVWERIFASINAEVKKKNRLARNLFHGAVGIGAEVARLKEEGQPVPKWMQNMLKLAERLVFSKIRARLGGRLRIAASGAAPLGKELGRFYASIGMPLIEGYGLTEGGVLTLNPLDRPKAGSIGVALPGVELRLAEDGELLAKSATLFAGYYKDPAATAAVLRDGWLYTGDIAEIDSLGYVYITGRKKELIVSSNGKKIYPARIEGLFKAEPIVSQVVLIGDRLPFITALMTVNVTNAETLSGMEPFKGRQPAEVAVAPPVLTEIQKAVARVNKQLAPFEQIRKFRILERDFSIETGELTPTMKVRRNRVLENNRELVSELYMGKEESQ
ncbi:MAG: long-chain fatty acid--CoA ligase [Bryobacteraceae bacterium]